MAEIICCRALAETWDTTPHAALSTYHNPINSISLFVLLDLLGAAEPNVPSFFQTTHWAYRDLADIEERMRNLGLLESKSTKKFFPDKEKTKFTRGYVQDDHIPFMARGVDILHVIAYPFPTVWHTMSDDAEHLDIPTVKDWARIMTAFAAEWMDLEGEMPPPPPPPHEKVKRERSDKTEL